MIMSKCLLEKINLNNNNNIFQSTIKALKAECGSEIGEIFVEAL